jgi:hypothetical protein
MIFNHDFKNFYAIVFGQICHNQALQETCIWYGSQLHGLSLWGEHWIHCSKCYHPKSCLGDNKGILNCVAKSVVDWMGWNEDIPPSGRIIICKLGDMDVWSESEFATTCNVTESSKRKERQSDGIPTITPIPSWTS